MNSVAETDWTRAITDRSLFSPAALPARLQLPPASGVGGDGVGDVGELAMMVLVMLVLAVLVVLVSLVLVVVVLVVLVVLMMLPAAAAEHRPEVRGGTHSDRTAAPRARVRVRMRARVRLGARVRVGFTVLIGSMEPGSKINLALA